MTDSVSLDERAERIRKADKIGGYYAIIYGCHLLSAKKALAPNAWNAWFKNNIGINPRFAEYYIRLAENFCSPDGRPLPNVTYTDCLKFLTLPEDEEFKFMTCCFTGQEATL